MKDTRKLEDQRDEHRVHLIVSQLICCPRRRKPVLTGAIAQPCQYIIEEKGWQILTLAIMPDHVHLFVRVWPGERASLVVKEIRASRRGTCGKSFLSHSVNCPPCGQVPTLRVPPAMSAVKRLNALSKHRRGFEHVPGPPSEHRQNRPTR